MKNLIDKLGFAIYTLLLTNIWIVLFNTLVFILNSFFPPTVKEVFITQPGTAEQFEIPVYILLSFFFILFIVLTHRLIKNIDGLPFFLKLIILLLLVIFFVSRLGPYPLYNQYDPYLPRPDKSTYFIVVFFYCLITTLIIASGRLLKGAYLYLFVILLLGSVTFDAGFPLTGHDYEYFIGPSYEIAQGKTIYTDILSRYAFLTPIAFALLNKLKILPLTHIPAVVWLLYIAQYFLCFYLINRLSKSNIFASVGTVAIITLNYFSLSHLPSVIPQVGPLRWFSMVLLIFLLFKFRKLDSNWFVASVALLSLFMIDSGIAIIFSYFITLLLSLAIGTINKNQIIRSFFVFILSLISLILIINLLHLLFGYKLINLTSAFYSLKKFALSGLSLMPISQKTYFWFIPLTYFSTIIYIFGTSLSSTTYLPTQAGNLRTTNLLLFSANLSLFASIYFVGRSHPHNLFNISLFPLLNFFLLLSLVFKNIKTSNFKLLTIVILFLIFIAIPAYQRRFTLTEMLLFKYSRITTGKLFKSEVEEIINTTYREDIKLIRSNFPDEAVILSSDDTYLFYASGKKNHLDVNPIMGIDVQEDIDFALKNAVKKCPEKIAIDCSFVGKCPSYTPFVGVSFDLKLILDKLEAGCSSKYRPEICSTHLCIATRQKI